MKVLIAAKIHLPKVFNSSEKFATSNEYKLQSRCHGKLPSVSPNTLTPRRCVLASGVSLIHGKLPSVSPNTLTPRRCVLASGVSLISVLAFDYGLMPLLARAGDESDKKEEKDEGVLGAIKTLFDPNEKTKSGKVLPKAYLKSAREVVKTLRESVNEDPKNNAKFRRTADAAKESIQDYIRNWRDQKTVVNEESYLLIEKVIRALASFYSKAGPSAPLPAAVKSEILDNLRTADEFL